MRIACQVMAKWQPEGNQASSRVYVVREGGSVDLYLPGQGCITFAPGDASVVGAALVEADQPEAPESEEGA